MADDVINDEVDKSTTAATNDHDNISDHAPIPASDGHLDISTRDPVPDTEDDQNVSDEVETDDDQHDISTGDRVPDTEDDQNVSDDVETDDDHHDITTRDPVPDTEDDQNVSDDIETDDDDHDMSTRHPVPDTEDDQNVSDDAETADDHISDQEPIPAVHPLTTDHRSSSSGYLTNSPVTVPETVLDQGGKCMDSARSKVVNHVTFVDEHRSSEDESDEYDEDEEPQETDELTIKEPVVWVAPDGGYGWVIVLASFSIQMIGISLGLSFGVMYVELQEYYQTEAAVTAWVGAICVGLALGAGPVSSLLAHAVGHRRSCMVGALVTASGLFVSAFSPSIFVLYITYGVITGIGIAITYVPAVVMVGFYFDRRRPMASGLAVSGVGFGSLIYPPLIQLLIDTYTWRGTMILLSGISLNMLVFAALLRPLPVKNVHTKVCDQTLLRDWVFIVFFVAEVLWNVGSLVILTIAPHCSILQGVGREEASFLLSVMGISGTLGRIVFVFIPVHWDKLTMMTAATYITGLPMALFPAVPVYWLHVTLSAVYGLAFGVQLAVLPVVTVDLFGLAKLTTAYGFIAMADGVGAMIGPFVGGYFYDRTGNYLTSFIVGAIVSLVSGICMTVILVSKLRSTTSRIRRFSLRDRKLPVAPPEPNSEIYL